MEETEEEAFQGEKDVGRLKGGWEGQWGKSQEDAEAN